jgi:3-hydroxyisobutyrate dehydrogenase-like beta-hydroxyacid dehydrogenase
VTPRIGFVGLGKMGLPMARRLVDAGLDPLVYDVAEPPRLVMKQQGARIAAAVRMVGEQCDVIGVCVPADQHVRTVCEGADGLFAAARPGTVIAIHSTVRPATIVELGRAAAGCGVGFLDACVSGGEAGAADGTLVYMVGGAAEDVERCRPMLEATGKLVVHTDELGTGTRMKLCNNAMTYVTLRAAFEACRLAQGAGLSIALVEEITQASGVLSDRMRSYLGSLKLPPEVVAMEAVQARLAHYVTVADKDLEIALELARDLGIDLPVTRSCAEGTAESYRQTPSGQGSSS